MKKLGSTLKPGTIPAATFAAAYTQLLHLIGTAVSAVPAMLAPVAAGVFGVHPARVGVLIAICFIVSIPTGLLTAGFVSRFGAARTGSFIAATSALSMLGMAVAGYGATWAGAGGVLSVWWFVALLVVVAVLLGFPLGMINPLSSQILFRASPTRLRAFFFSVKQTAVPGAYAVAGLVVPALLLLLSWQATLLVLTLGTLLWTLLTLTVFVEVNPPAAGRPSFRRTFIDPVVTVTRSPPLREMGIVSMLFSMNQTVMSAYLVSYLNLEVGLSLVAAGAIFAAGQVAGIVGRLGWGLSADLWIKPRIQIGLLGVAGGIVGLVIANFDATWSHSAMLVVCVLFGLSAVSWNGIFLAEVARLAAQRNPGDVGTITGGTGVYNSTGALLGPGLCSLIVTATGKYAIGLAVFAVPALLWGIWLLVSREPKSS